MTTTTKETKQAAIAENTAASSAKSGMDSYLFNEHPLVVRPELARAVGLNEAIVLQQVHYWCGKNEGRNHNSRDGFTWTYGSYEYWQSQFPWWSVHTVRRTFANLVRSGLLVSRRFNHLPQDRTKWYRVDEDEVRRRVLAKLPDHVPKMDTSSVQNGQLQQSKMDRPLPETNQRLTPETTTGIEEEGEETLSSETAADAAAGVLDFFKQNFPNIEFTPVIREELESLTTRFQSARVRAAIKEARRHKVDSPLPYIGKVLENEEKEEKGPADGKFHFDSAPHVWVTEEEVLDLVKRFRNDGAAARINFISRHKGSTKKFYESDYETILLWDARGNWNPKPQGWEINQQWLDSIQPKQSAPLTVLGGNGSSPGSRPSRNFVICGYIPGNGSRSFKGHLVEREIASVILGLPGKNGTFSYHGKCGSGFGIQEMTELYNALQGLRVEKSVFNQVDEVEVIKRSQSLHFNDPVWVRPQLVAEITHKGFTKKSRLFGPMLKQLRPELKPQEVKGYE